MALGILGELRQFRTLLDPTNRLVDIAVRFDAYDLDAGGKLHRTGASSPVYGGKYDLWACQYVADADDVHVLPVSEPQLELVLSDALKVEASGGRGGGKSNGGVARAIRFICERPGEDGRVISPIQDLTEVVRGKLLKQIPLRWLAPRGIILSKPPKLKFVHGVEVEFRTSKTPDSLRSWGGSWTLVDEAQDVSTYAIDIAWPCLRETPKPRMWFTLTPKTGEAFKRHKVYEKASTAECIGFSSYSNPFAFREVHDESAKDESEGGMSRDTYQIEIEADWETIAKLDAEDGPKPVFPYFDRERHRWRGNMTPGLMMPVDITRQVVAPRAQAARAFQWEYIAGADPNGSRPNYAVIWKVYRQRSAREPHVWRAVDVVLKKGHCGHLGKEMTERGYTPKNTWVIMDASGRYNRLGFAKASAEKMREEGFLVVTPPQNPKWRRSLEDVACKMDPVRGDPTMYLDLPRCEVLADHFERAVYDKSGNCFDQSFEPDAVDAARYPVSFIEPSVRAAPIRGIL
jgi:hypothetical protein